MGVLKLLCLTVFGVLWGILWTAHDEDAHLVDSIQEGAFEMSYSAYELLSKESGAFVEIGESGWVIVGTAEQGSITLSAQEVYSLLDVLYRRQHILRQRADTVPLPAELPEWAQPEHAPDGSNYHDERCRCPGCNYDGPEPTEEEGGRIMREMGPDPTEEEQWQATGTCQIDEKHTGRDIFRCDGCQRMCCNQCGEVVDDLWLCEACILPKEPIMTYPF